MSDRVFVIAGSSTDLLPGAIVPEQMVKDLSLIAQIPIGTVQAVAAAVGQADTFLSERRLTELVSAHVADEERSSAIVSALNNLRPERLENVFQSLENWRAASPRNAERLGEDALADLRHKLPELIRPYSAIAKSRKFRRLQAITGNSLESVDVICDARPIFNEARDRIEGVIPMTTLKLLYERQNGEAEVLEILVPPERLDEIVRKLENARRKLRVIKDSLPYWMPEDDD